MIMQELGMFIENTKLYIKDQSVLKSTLIKYVFIGLALVAISDVPNTLPYQHNIARFLIEVIVFLSFFIPRQQVAFILLAIAVCGQDNVSTMSVLTGPQEVYATASLWQIHLGILSPSLVFFSVLVVQFIKLNKVIIPPQIKLNIIWFTTIPIITGLIYGGFFSEFATIEVISDLRFPLMLLFSMVFFLSFFVKYPHCFAPLLFMFVALLIARHFVDLSYFLFNLGPGITEFVSRGSEDSAKGGIVFLIFLGMILGQYRKYRVAGGVLAILSIALLGAYGTRMLWITFLLGIVLLFLFLKLRKAITILLMFAIVTSGGIWALYTVKPESAEIVFLRMKTITEGRDFDSFTVGGASYNTVSRIDPVRYGEILNILNNSAERVSFLLGSGYGSFYKDDIVSFPRDLKSSFPDYSLASKQFYTAHDFVPLIFFKYGIIGLILISSLWLVPGLALFNLFRKRKRLDLNKPGIETIMLALVPFLLTGMFQLYWSGKGLFINGFILASCIMYIKNYNIQIVNGK